MNSELTIVGGGMVANGFAKSYLFSAPATIFASGVSDSSCCDEAKFVREKDLLEFHLSRCDTSRYFLYFGTCSVYDSSLVGSPYVLHKRRMERLVLSSPIGRIIRLPQLVGIGAPPTTLVPYLVSCIRSQTSFSLWSKSYRNILNIDHVVAIVSQLAVQELADIRIHNVACPFNISIPDLVFTIETALGIKARCEHSDRESRYNIEVNSILDAASRAGVNFDRGYYERIVAGYIADEF